MKTNRSAASLNPQFRVVIQFTTLSGIWSRKIAQFAMPRNRSMRRSRPFSGRVALIFMGLFRDAFVKRISPAAGRPRDGKLPEIVTARHSDYTGPEKAASKAGVAAQS